jgi:hypothetical protein
MLGRVFTVILLSVFSAVGAPLQIRVATYNASLNRSAYGQLAIDLNSPNNAQAKKVAEIIQRVAPDIILVNEFDYDGANPNLARDRFHDNYLAISQNGQPALNYPYRYAAPTNTGVPTGASSVADGDFDNNGVVDTTPGDDTYGNDCFGFGQFPGQYSFVVYSKFPIVTAQIRSFQFFKWKDMPSPNFPDNSGTPTPADYYTASEKSIFRLSSKNHVDLPIELKPGHILHLLASHPTPPSFDTAEDRNGRRNFDEIRLWADYINNAQYLYDDAGVHGGIDDDQRFIILADLNADPFDGDSFVLGGVRAINQLRNHPRVNSTFNPSSPGGTQQSQLQGGANNSQLGNPAYDTSDFSDSSPGNLRVDHILPSKVGLNPVSGGVFWPLNTDPTFALVNASDHRLVWTDYAVVPVIRQAVKGLSAATQGSDVVIKWKAQAGVTYKVEQSNDLATWSDTPTIAVNVDPGTQNATATDVGGMAGAMKYYRVVTSLDATSPAAAVRTSQPISAARIRKRK